jgi:hypothetical protein
MMIMVVPYMVSADCKMTDTTEKFEVVCSGPGAYAPASDVRKNAKKTRRGRKTKRVEYEEREGVMPTVVMNDVESQFMLARNRQDGYCDKLKPRGQSGKRGVDGQGRNI